MRKSLRNLICLFVLYDVNGGTNYLFSPNNTEGGNCVGFGDYFTTIEGVDTSDYYTNCNLVTDENGQEQTILGRYTSHAALPNTNWETNDDKTSPHEFRGWSVLDESGNLVILKGIHTITYDPTLDNGGIVSFRAYTISRLLFRTPTAAWLK